MVPPDRIDILERRLDLVVQALRQPPQQTMSYEEFEKAWADAATEPVTLRPMKAGG